MKFSHPKFPKYLGVITLVLLILLAGLKFYLGGCRLWLCMAFVGIVVTYMIINDLHGDNHFDSTHNKL